MNRRPTRPLFSVVFAAFCLLLLSGVAARADNAGRDSSNLSGQLYSLTPKLIGLVFGLSELILNLVKRARSNAVSKDRHSWTLIWIVNVAAILLAVYADYHLSRFWMPNPKVVVTCASTLLVLGLALRWYAILYLGRFFTVTVAIAGDHRLIDSGPYRWIRHPSYTGALLATFALALSLGNWVSLLILFVPSFAVNQWRIHVEKQALMAALPGYAEYARRTKRLIPWVY